MEIFSFSGEYSFFGTLPQFVFFSTSNFTDFLPYFFYFIFDLLLIIIVRIRTHVNAREWQLSDKFLTHAWYLRRYRRNSKRQILSSHDLFRIRRTCFATVCGNTLDMRYRYWTRSTSISSIIFSFVKIFVVDIKNWNWWVDIEKIKLVYRNNV